MEPVWWAIIASAILDLLALGMAYYSIRESRRLNEHKFGAQIVFEEREGKLYIKNIGKGFGSSVECMFIDNDKDEYHLSEIDFLQENQERELELDITFLDDWRFNKQNKKLDIDYLAFAKVSFSDVIGRTKTNYFSCLISAGEDYLIGVSRPIRFTKISKDEFKSHLELL